MEGRNMLPLLMLLANLAVLAKGQKESPPAGEPGAPGASGATGAAGPVGQAGPTQQDCGTTSFTNAGLVTSPRYPNSYYSYADCTYSLTAGAGGRVHLTFNDFILEANFDFLEIRSDGLFVGRYTGSTIPPALTLGSTASLRFTSDINIELKGFSVSFTTIASNCGGLIVSAGVIQSPGYPAAYSANRLCVWGVVPTQGQSLTLDFLAFSVESNYDWLEVYQGNTRVARYTGFSIPPRAILSSPGRVIFSSDSTVQNAGINIAANSAVLTCGGSITGTTTISSPNYPTSYPNSASCTWTYRAVSSAVATRLTFTAFNTEATWDLVKIYEGENLRITNSGTQVPKPIQLRSDTVTVVFTSDSNTVFQGFQLQFSPVF